MPPSPATLARRMAQLEAQQRAELAGLARRLQAEFATGRLGRADGRFVAHDEHLAPVAALLNLAQERRAAHGRRYV